MCDYIYLLDEYFSFFTDVSLCFVICVIVNEILCSTMTPSNLHKQGSKRSKFSVCSCTNCVFGVFGILHYLFTLLRAKFPNDFLCESWQSLGCDHFSPDSPLRCQSAHKRSDAPRRYQPCTHVERIGSKARIDWLKA